MKTSRFLIATTISLVLASAAFAAPRVGVPTLIPRPAPKVVPLLFIKPATKPKPQPKPKLPVVPVPQPKPKIVMET